MYQRALAGYDKSLGPDHTSTLDTVNNLSLLYSDQGQHLKTDNSTLTVCIPKEGS